jgi:hypothetical protein
VTLYTHSSSQSIILIRLLSHWSIIPPHRVHPPRQFARYPPHIQPNPLPRDPLGRILLL